MEKTDGLWIGKQEEDKGTVEAVLGFEEGTMGSGGGGHGWTRIVLLTWAYVLLAP